MHGCKLMFLSVFQLLQTYVSSVSSGRCIYFAMPTHVFFWCFRRMLQVLQLFRTYVASVSGCCKSRSSVAHVAMGPTCCRACAWEAEGREAKGNDGGRGTAGPRLCVQQGAGCPLLYGWNQITFKGWVGVTGGTR
jgi:hypothetical protein